MNKILVWDLPTRIGHWLLVLTFAVAYLTGDSEEWRLVHVATGYALGGALAFRLFWGIVGSRYARFSSFLFSPNSVLLYLKDLFKGRPSKWTGHNPAGSYAIFLLLLCAMGVVCTGWAVYAEVGGDWLEDAHDTLSYVMLCIVGIHVSGVVVSSSLHRENLVRAMVTGYKIGRGEHAIESSEKYWVFWLFGFVGLASLMTLVS